jgi:O-methyltransferase
MYLAWRIKRKKMTFLQFPHLLSLVENYLLVKSRRPKPLHVAEFGVGRGGSAMLLAWLVGQYGGSLTLFDIFGRIPPPSEIDGEQAEIRYRFILTQESEDYYGNIPNLLDTILEELEQVCDRSKIDIVKGKYEDTLPTYKGKRNYDLAHIDCDWYESSKAVWDFLKKNLSGDAIIQVDDYSNWQGSKKAFDEIDWLSETKKKIVCGALVIDRKITSQ